MEILLIQKVAGIEIRFEIEDEISVPA